MEIIKAKEIGYKQAFKAITIGLVFAYLLMALLSRNPFWLFEFNYAGTISFAVLTLYSSGYIFGKLAGVAIIIKHKPAFWSGIKYGFLIIWVSTFLASLIGFFKEGLANPGPTIEPFNDYIVKPLFMISVFGFLPILLIGFWFGYSIKNKKSTEEIIADNLTM